MLTLRLLPLLFVFCCAAGKEKKEKKEGNSLSDYLPMYQLTASRSAAEEDGATKSLFYDFLPSELGGRKAKYLEIRSFFSGDVQVIESGQFGISVNISSMNTFTLASVELQYTAVDDTILLQLMNEDPVIHGGLSSLVILAIALGALLCIAMLLTCAYICFWMMKFKEHDKDGAEETRDPQTLLSPESVLSGDISQDRPGSQNQPAVGNGDIGRHVQLSSQQSLRSDNNHSKPSSMNQRRHRHRASTHRDISSSDDVSSIDDNWTKRKASWKKGHVKRTQFTDVDITSGDGGFSSSNEFRPHRNRHRGVRRHNPSLDELEWDEYETGEAALPPPSTSRNGWQFSTDDEKTQDNIWPPPIDEIQLPSEDSDKGSNGNLQDVREAINSAMDSVNRDAKGFYRLVSCESGTAGARQTDRQAPPAHNPESPHDDGYETGVAINGAPNLTSPGSKLPVPPVAPKPPKGGGGSGGGSKFGMSRLPMTIVMSLMVLSLIAGAYGVVSNLTRASIVVFIPDNFFKEVNVYINDSDRIHLDMSRKPKNTKVQLFDSNDPIIHDLSVNQCDQNKNCQHSCNRKTGVCSCNRGYLLFEEVKCADRSDCLYLPCPHMETCSNTIGAYECACSLDYWRDHTGTCVLCAGASCQTGSYESNGCPNRKCIACRTECPDGQYITAACSANSDTLCADCSPPCQDDEYEYKPCTSFSNRKCDKIKDIPAAKGSSGLILESVTNRRNAESEDWWMDSPSKQQQFTLPLVRGSGISIKVSVKSINLFPTLTPVEHKESNDNEAFIDNDGPASILTTYCPSPLPLHYELLPIEHNNVTAAKSSDCPDCPIDPRQPCATYKKFGTEAALHPRNISMVCSAPDKLADTFNLNSYLSEYTSMIVQPSAECEILKESCDSCSRGCAEDIIKQSRTNCSITSEDDPDSWSPRLMYCQNCCLNRNCRRLCNNVQRCKPVSCWRGNLAEFLLLTKFPPRKMEFYCNMKIDERVQLISLDYTVLHNNTELKNFTITLYQNEATVQQNSYSDGLLSIEYNTGIDTIPDLVHGEIDIASLSANYTSGSYMPVGEAASRVSVSRLNIMPKVPFSFSTKWWKTHNCSESIIDKFLIGGGDGGSMMSKQPHIHVSKQGNYLYTLWNRSHQPFVRFSIPVSLSVIQKLYPPVKLDANKIKAVVHRASTGWRLVVSGQAVTCPGYFTLKVWELKKTVPLAEYEVAVRGKECNRDFSVTFNIAGGETNQIQRKFRVELIDKANVRHFIQVESDAPGGMNVKVNKPEQLSEYPRSSTRSAFIIILPFLMVIAATIIMLSIAWVVSVVIPRDRGPVKSGPRTRATLFFFYALIRVIYILATSLSIFAFIWYAMNGVDLVVVQNYSDAIDTVISRQQHDLRTLVDFSSQKVQSQREEFKSMKEICFRNIESLQNQSQKMMQELSADMSSELSTLPLRNDLITSLDNRAKELREKLELYRQNYNSFAQVSSSKLVLEISKTVEDFVKTDWLHAARIIRGAYANKRQSSADSVRGFQKWMGIRSQLHAIQTNFEMGPLPIAGIESLSLPPVPSSPKYQSVDLHSIFLPTHDLYSETKEPQVSRADKYERSYGISLGSRISLLTVLIVLLLLDLLTLTSRVAETLDTGQQILDGYVLEKTYATTYQDGCSSAKFIAQKLIKKPHRVRYRLYKLVLTTNCVPLLIALLSVLGITFAGLMASLRFVSLDNLNDVGLFSSLVGPWNLTSNIALDNIQLNVERTNMADIPSAEAMMNEHIQRIEILNNIYNNFSYYKWQIECGDSPSDRCGDFDYTRLIQPLNIKDIDCNLLPLDSVDPSDIPNTLTDLKVKELILPYVKAFRRIAESTACLLLTYTSYLLIVKMLSVVLWNFLTRTAHVPGVRVQITNILPREEERGKPSDSAEDIPTHMTFNRSTIEEMSHEDDGSLDDGELSEVPSQNESEHDSELKHENLPNGGIQDFHY